MELVAKTLRRYSSAPGFDLSVLLDMTLFIFVTGNGDLHLINFSLIYDGKERRLPPAYDMLSTRLVMPEQDDTVELASTLCGKKSNFKARDFIKFADTIGFSNQQYNAAIKRLSGKLPKILDVLSSSFLPEAQIAAYKRLISARLARLDIIP